MNPQDTPSAEIKPCPFCGNENVDMDMIGVKGRTGKEPSLTIDCANPKCFMSQYSRGGPKPYDNADECLKAWNTRATHPTPKSEAQILELAEKHGCRVPAIVSEVKPDEYHFEAPELLKFVSDIIASDENRLPEPLSESEIYALANDVKVNVGTEGWVVRFARSIERKITGAG